MTTANGLMRETKKSLFYILSNLRWFKSLLVSQPNEEKLGRDRPLTFDLWHWSPQSESSTKASQYIHIYALKKKKNEISFHEGMEISTHTVCNVKDTDEKKKKKFRKIRAKLFESFVNSFCFSSPVVLWNCQLPILLMSLHGSVF